MIAQLEACVYGEACGAAFGTILALVPVGALWAALSVARRDFSSSWRGQSISARWSAVRQKELHRAVMKDFYSELEAVLHPIPVDLGGGCSADKARLMAELIRRYRLRSTVDIGVYRGRSLFPQAMAHGRFTGGVVYGVDPFMAAEARQDDDHRLAEQLVKWLQVTDFLALYEEVASLRERLDLQAHCVLVRQTSQDAIGFFRDNRISFDLVHIDGNHDAEKVMMDVDLYLPRLRRNGFLVLDDPSWASIRPAYERLRRTMTLVFERRDAENDYAVFWNGAPFPRGLMRRRVVQSVGRG